MTNFAKIAIVLLVGVSLVAIVFLAGSVFGAKNDLPYPGPPGHQPGAFAFTNQEGKVITEDSVYGKVTVVEFFFTTCPGICKEMNKNLGTVYAAFSGNNSVRILSHTVDPEHDSVDVLRAYAGKLNASAPVWQFLTGDKERLYKTARIDYLLSVEDPPADIEDDFIHTEYVALIDKRRKIRGYYDATDELATRQLIEDIDRLLDE